MRAGDHLKAMAETWAERNQAYGNNYHVHGEVMLALFPEGIKLMSVDDFNRYALIVFITSKLSRYCEQWHTGHPDSLHDMSVYAAMLLELDELPVRDK